MGGSDGSNGTLPRVLLLDNDVRLIRTLKADVDATECDPLGVGTEDLGSSHGMRVCHHERESRIGGSPCG